MSLTYGFYDSLNGDRKYNAVQMASIFDGIVGDGVFAATAATGSITNNCFSVTAVANTMTVSVGTGRAWFNHTWTLNDSAIVLTIPDSEIILNRIDAVVLEINSTAQVRANSIKVISGTPGSVPAKPTMTHSGGIDQYALAYITVAAEATAITQSNIEYVVGTTETPYVTALMSVGNISSHLAQWKSQVFDWMADNQADFDAWFATFVDELSTEQATNLQNQINDINKHIHLIVTYDPSLAGASIVATNGTETHTIVASSSGTTTFNVTKTGNWHITENMRSTETYVYTPYYGDYTTNIGGDRFLVITYSSEFNGLTFTATLGSTVINRVATSSGTMTFGVVNDGNWKISATYDGRVYDRYIQTNGAGTYTARFDAVILYGFKISKSDSNPATRVTYLPGTFNENYSRAYMDFANDTFVYGSWADAFFMPRPCMVKNDGTVDYYLSPNNYEYREDGITISDISNLNYAGNAMMEFPTVYFKRYEDANYRYCYISNAKVDQYYQAYAHHDKNGVVLPYIYIGIYEAAETWSGSTGILRSMSGTTAFPNGGSYETRVSHFYYRLLEDSQHNGTNWGSYNFSDRMMINDLLVLMSKTTDSQSAYGKGYTSSTLIQSGQLNNKGLFYGKNTSSFVKVFGIENWWGSTSKVAAGCIFKNVTSTTSGYNAYQVHIKATYGTEDGSTTTGYNSTGNGYIPVPGATYYFPGSSSSGYVSGYISDLKTTNYGFVPYPTAISGSSTTYETDSSNYHWYYSQDEYVFRPMYGGFGGNLLNSSSDLGVYAAQYTFMYGWYAFVNVTEAASTYLEYRPVAST